MSAEETTCKVMGESVRENTQEVPVPSRTVVRKCVFELRDKLFNAFRDCKF